MIPATCGNNSETSCNGADAAVDCVYRGEVKGGSDLYQCYRLGECVLSSGGNGREDLPACDTCTSRITSDAADLGQKWVDPLQVYNRRMEVGSALRDILGGRAVFLACAGPSANSLPLEQLNSRGCWTLAMNNMAGHSRFRPQAFTCHDPPSKFSYSIWMDPQIMKFCPTSKISAGRGSLRKKEAGAFIPMGTSTLDAPNVWGVARRKWLRIDDTFFTHPEASIGNFDAGVALTGEPKTICSMLFAMRVLKFLGAGVVFILGADFQMNSALPANYAFSQARDNGACQSNNNIYHIANDWLCRLQQQGVFQRFGIEFYNCCATSGLRAFEYVPFEEAYQVVTKDVESVPDLSGWYEK